MTLANSAVSTSSDTNPSLLKDFKWMLKISSLPFKLGRKISICTSKRPARRRASSIKSFLLVIPIIKILFGESTPSISVNNWFTRESPKAESDPPLFLVIESISSKMMTWRELSYFFYFHSLNAGSKISLNFFSPSP